MQYAEGVLSATVIMIGKLPVRFPLGSASYTAFAYSDLRLSSHAVKDTDVLQVSLKVKNIGMLRERGCPMGVADRRGPVVRPGKELRNFVKVALAPGEEKEVTRRFPSVRTLGITRRSATGTQQAGEYEILVGSSSRISAFVIRWR